MIDNVDLLKIFIAAFLAFYFNILIQNKAAITKKKNTFLSTIEYFISLLETDKFVLESFIEELKENNNITNINIEYNFFSDTDIIFDYNQMTDIFRIHPHISTKILKYLKLRKIYVNYCSENKVSLDYTNKQYQACINTIKILKSEKIKYTQILQWEECLPYREWQKYKQLPPSLKLYKVLLFLFFLFLIIWLLFPNIFQALYCIFLLILQIHHS